MKKFVLFLLVTLVYVAHQDFWNWKTAAPLLFGFLPVGLTYHAAYAVLCAIMMAVLVKVAWPKHLEAVDPSRDDRDPGSQA